MPTSDSFLLRIKFQTKCRQPQFPNAPCSVILSGSTDALNALLSCSVRELLVVVPWLVHPKWLPQWWSCANTVARSKFPNNNSTLLPLLLLLLLLLHLLLLLQRAPRRRCWLRS